MVYFQEQRVLRFRLEEENDDREDRRQEKIVKAVEHEMRDIVEKVRRLIVVEIIGKVYTTAMRLGLGQGRFSQR